MGDSETLADALPKEIERVSALIPLYEQIGPAGNFATAMMKASIQQAQRAISNNDTVGMIAAYRDLEGYTA